MDLETLLAFARGPLFRASFIFLVLGVLRIAVLQGVDLGRAWTRTRGSGLPWLKRTGAFAAWTWRSSPALEFKGWAIFITFLFYTLVIFVALFLIDHVLLWYAGLGLWWRAMSKPAADAFALLALACGAALLLVRTLHGPTRRLSDRSDYVIILLLLGTMGAGLLAAHPALLVPGYGAAMAVHVLGADLVFLLFPFSRVAHEVFRPVPVPDPEGFAREAMEHVSIKADQGSEVAS